jgi:septation ring formation regulator EzrA
VELTAAIEALREIENNLDKIYDLLEGEYHCEEAALVGADADRLVSIRKMLETMNEQT